MIRRGLRFVGMHRLAIIDRRRERTSLFFWPCREPFVPPGGLTPAAHDPYDVQGTMRFLHSPRSPRNSPMLIRVGHSPDPDDAFMFHALANGKIDTGRYEFRHELVDIETLNRRAFAGEFGTHGGQPSCLCPSDRELYALPLRREHGRPLWADGRRPRDVSLPSCAGLTIAVPGTLTTAYLALRLCLGSDFRHVVVPFDRIIDAVVDGHWESEPIRGGAHHSRGAIDLCRSGPAAGGRSGPMVVRANGIAAAAGGQCDSQEPWPRGDPRRESAVEREHSLRIGPSRRRRSIMRCSLAAIWIAGRPIGSSECM